MKCWFIIGAFAFSEKCKPNIFAILAFHFRYVCKIGIYNAKIIFQILEIFSCVKQIFNSCWSFHCISDECNISGILRSGTNSMINIY